MSHPSDTEAEAGPVVDDVTRLTPPFKVSPQDLMNLVDPKNPEALRALGGVAGVAASLHVDLAQGVSDAALAPAALEKTENASGSIETVSISARHAAFGSNYIPPTKQRTILLLFWDALHEKILIMLIVAALVSLGVGIFQDTQDTGSDDHGYSWIEGLAILIAVLVCSLVSAANDYQKERAFRRLSAKIANRTLRIVRNGSECQIGIHELVVGDVLLLEPGDVLPADGIIIEAFNMSCDESGATGESDAIPKAPLKDKSSTKDDAKKGANMSANTEDPEHPCDPFVLAGTKLMQGIGKALVIAVGRNSSSGRIMVSLSAKKENTPLQQKLDDLAERIAKIGAATALAMLLALVVKFVIVESKHGFSQGSIYNTRQITNIFIQAITILVVAVPEGLPMAVTIALAFATAKMVADNNLVRVLAACETMGNATTICSDKTGTLTTNVMTVVQGKIGGLECASIEKVKQDFKNILRQELRDLLVKSIVYNSTASLTPSLKKAIDAPAASSLLPPAPIQNTAGVGSKTEIAMLDLATHICGSDPTSQRSNIDIHALYPFSSAAKSMTVVIKEATQGFCIYTKGASEIILALCDREYAQDGSLVKIATETWLAYIDTLARNGLRTIAMAIRRVSDERELNQVLRPSSSTDSLPPFRSNSFCLLGIVGIQDPVRPGVPQAVLSCQQAGIMVRMVTGDNATTAASIARSCHILTRGGLTLEGPAFRALSDSALISTLPRLQVLARSSPLDKERLVRALKSQGHVVAATGDGTNDGPALRAADVGMSMGIAGTEVAKEASSIVLLDDNFTSVVKAVAWGRCVNDSVRKFLQFQLTVNLTAVVVAFVSACIDKECRSALTAVQLLWVNLLMDTMAALALATDSPTPALLERKPESKRQNLVTRDMWKIIIGTAAFQVTAMLVLLYLGPSIFGLDRNVKADMKILRTIIFNTFVWLQIFNEINCRVLGSRSLNPFSSFFSNWIFIAVLLFTILGQVIIVTWLGAGFSTTPLSIGIWGICIAIGAISLPVGLILRLLPTLKEPIRDATRDAERAAFSKERLQWQAAITDVRHGLSVFAALRRSQQAPSLVALSTSVANSRSHQSSLNLLPTVASPTLQ